MRIRYRSICVLGGIILFLSACSSMSRNGLNSVPPKKEAPCFAVLNFDVNCFLEREKLGDYTADQLTILLFKRCKYNVVDRAQVKARVREDRISPLRVHADDIQRLGAELGAEYLVFGDITCLGERDFDFEKKQKISIEITFRVISSQDGKVVSIVTKYACRRTGMKDMIYFLLAKMTKSLNLK